MPLGRSDEWNSSQSSITRLALRKKNLSTFAIVSARHHDLSNRFVGGDSQNQKHDPYIEYPSSYRPFTSSAFDFTQHGHFITTLVQPQLCLCPLQQKPITLEIIRYFCNHHALSICSTRNPFDRTTIENTICITYLASFFLCYPIHPSLLI